MPTEGLSADTRALIELAAHGTADKPIGSPEWAVAVTSLAGLAARAEGPAPPGGGGEEDYRGSLRSAPGSTSHRTDGAGEGSKAEADVLAELLGLAWTLRDYAHDMLTGALRGRDGQSYEAIGAEDLARVDAAIAKVEGRSHG